MAAGSGRAGLRVVFAGTPEFAAVALADLLRAGFAVPLVLTQPDRPAGRSGWVSTKGTAKPARSKSASATAANSGVPAKTTRKPARPLPAAISADALLLRVSS